MQTTRKWLSRIIQLAGLLLLLALFAWGVDWASRQAELAQNATPLPAASEPLSYPPPEQATSLPTPSATVPGYPPPPVYPTPLPTFTPTPTTTPWPISALPPLPTYAPPGPFSGMRVLIFGSTTDGNIRLINVDGTIEAALEPDDLPFYIEPKDLRVSPNGDRLLVSQYSSMFRERASIWVVDSTGNNPVNLVQVPEGGEWYPRSAEWSPDGSEIATLRIFMGDWGFSSVAHEIWLMDSEGSNQQLIYRDDYPEGGSFNIGQFKWFRNGYIYVINHEDRMVALNPRDGSVYPIADLVDYILPFANFDPDGRVIPPAADNPSIPLAVTKGAVRRSESAALWLYFQNGSLWLYDSITGDDRILVTGSQRFAVHEFSPDNRYVAYRKESQGLFVIDLLDPTLFSRLIVPEPVLQGAYISFVAWIPKP